MAFHYSPRIVNDNSLILYLDGLNINSYNATGSTWFDISKSDQFDMNKAGINLPYYDDGSFQLTGNNSYFSGSGLDIGDKGTVNIWFKQDSPIINKGLFGLGSNCHLYIGSTASSTKTALSIFNGTSYGPNVDLNNSTSWNFASFVWNGVSTKVYLNSTNFDTGDISFSKSGAFYLGVYPTFNSNSYFNGKIANVQVYNRDLSDDEINQNFEALKYRFGL